MIETRIRQETFYVTQRRFDRDVVDVFVIRYTWEGSVIVNAEHLRPPDPQPWGTPGGWESHLEGTHLTPCLSIPGVLVHLLRTVEPYDSGPAERLVEDLILRVLGRPARSHDVVVGA